MQKSIENRDRVLGEQQLSPAARGKEATERQLAALSHSAASKAFVLPQAPQKAVGAVRREGFRLSLRLKNSRGRHFLTELPPFGAGFLRSKQGKRTDSQ